MRERNKPVVASIGTTHPLNIAGLGLDIVVARDLGLRPLSVIAGVSAQDERGVHGRLALPPELVRAQLEALPMNDVGAVRVGALPSASIVEEVAAFLRVYGDVPAVVDPVTDASLGGALADESACQKFRECILPLPIVLTPNVPEAGRLLDRAIEDREAMVRAAGALQQLGPRAVLIKGGHLQGLLCDVLVQETQTTIFTDDRLNANMRGGGCVLAAAVACRLALGAELTAAVTYARAYVRTKIAAHTTFTSLQVAF